MPANRYSIEPHGRKRLALNWTWAFGETVVRLDGVELGRVDHDGLLNGVEYVLRDHTVLRIWLGKDARGRRCLFLTRNGRPLPGSEGDPARILLITLSISWFFAALQALFGMLMIFGPVLFDKRGVHHGAEDFVERFSNTPWVTGPDAFLFWNLAAGLVLVLLGILAWRRSMTAMVIASVIWLGEIASLASMQSKITADTAWRLTLLLGFAGLLLTRGVMAIRTLNASTLPVRHVPKPMHHPPPPHPSEPSRQPQ